MKETLTTTDSALLKTDNISLIVIRGEAKEETLGSFLLYLFAA